MQDLRLVGVHDDGEHLLLSGTGGEMFQLPIDEALRVAASRTAAKAASGAAPIAMSPRDIQARIRSGSTAAEVAELSGIPLAKVQRYEGPVLAEREHVAAQAQKVEVAAPAPGHDVYRSVFGDQPALLGDMVAHRLSAHGIDASTVEWDSWRRPDGSWNVVARFEAKAGGPAGIGEEPPAMWTFSPARKSLQNANRWAQQLSELEPLDGPVPARRLAAVSDRPFDFETDADAAARTATAQLQVVQQLQLQQEQESDGLLDMLRSRRGQRLGVDEDADDALATLLTNGVPAAHPRPSEVPAEVSAEPEPAGTGGNTPEPEDTEQPVPAADRWERRRDGRPSIMSRLTLAPRHQDAPDDALRLHDGVSTETREITIAASQLRPVGKQGPVSSPGLDELLGGGTSRRQQREPAAAARDDRDAEQPERQPAKPKRSSIPSWDDIVFGARGD
ncbi:septation protein SepH [Arthrobacter sp. AL08]|uniref:septation protein SepH n=1 Tax=Micrococcaceae TaxID=1268 RepID=UPI00249BEC68|nr:MULTISPECIES: septation protein SepH [Micrococcaceae]MDI3241608.1 septation protein SepH [Arthrobacter sp. AL05]MDI3277618.1 septation protein SepH [Arthrobacter sp. AL08]MDJ0353500.1 septation protein SepH [Pseudarthrobacter sp. PH31-O2]